MPIDDLVCQINSAKSMWQLGLAKQIWFGKFCSLQQFSLAIQFGNSVWHFSLAIQFGSFVW
jgi:hypothetical protein